MTSARMPFALFCRIVDGLALLSDPVGLPNSGADQKHNNGRDQNDRQLLLDRPAEDGGEGIARGDPQALLKDHECHNETAQH